MNHPSNIINTIAQTNLSRRAPAGKCGRVLAAYFVLTLLLAGCASTEVSNRERLVYEKLPRPNQILVYNFASSAADVPADSAFAGPGSAPTAPPTDEEATLGREL